MQGGGGILSAPSPAQQCHASVEGFWALKRHFPRNPVTLRGPLTAGMEQDPHHLVWGSCECGGRCPVLGMLRVRTHPEADGRVLQHPPETRFHTEKWDLAGSRKDWLPAEDLDTVGCRCLQKGPGLEVRMAFAALVAPMIQTASHS